MKYTFAKMIAVAVMAVALPFVAFAQPCVPTFNGAPFTPSTELHLGESACLQFCGGFDFVNFYLVGADLDEVGIPVLTALPGCNPSSTSCSNPNCTPIVPPTSFTLGGGVFFPRPDWWGGYTDCVEITYHFAHDQFWEIEITVLCEGCFCLSFDDQLAAELSSFDAVSAENRVNVSWVTASESDLDHFNLLRDGVKVFETRAFNNPAGHAYTWADANVVNGVTYSYTLESVDVNNNVSVLGATSSTPGSNEVVAEFRLEQNYPNPFNPETNIAYSLPTASNVTLSVYNLLGQEVASLFDGAQTAGAHVIRFDGSNLTSGVYVYRLEADGFSATRKMVLMK